MKFSVFIKVLFALLMPFLMTGNLYSFSDQTTTERVLRENKKFVNFIDMCVTNFSQDKEKLFLAAYNLHFNGEIAFLQSDYKRSYKKVYSSQGELLKLYEYMLKNIYLEDSKNILDSLAPRVIRSKNSRARLYLTLGYRDRTVSSTHFIVGEATNLKLYSYKLYKYEEGIKMARRAKRYGFLALYESLGKDVRKRIYNDLCKKEAETGKLFFRRFIDKSEKQVIEELAVDFDSQSAPQTFKKDGVVQTTVFEKKVEKRVRFRNEKRLANFLLNGDFDQSEDILRKYIDDFNFKIINSTLDVLNSDAKKSGSKEADFLSFKLHLLDNYKRLSKSSILDSFHNQVKVEDGSEKVIEAIESDNKKENNETKTKDEENKKKNEDSSKNE